MRNAKIHRHQLLLGLGLCALAPLLVGFLCYPLVLPASSGVGTPAALFAPTVSANVLNTAPGAASNVEAHISFPSGSTLAIGAAFDIPAGWQVANATVGSIVGTIEGFMTVADPFFFNCATTVSFDSTDVPPTDIRLLEATTSTTSTVPGTDTDNDGKPEVVEDNDGNGLPDGVDKYAAFLNTILPGTHKARYFGHTEAAGLSDLYVNVLVDELAPGGPYRVITIVNDPTAPPESATNQFCAPQSLTLTLFGTSANNPTPAPTIAGGTPVYTNPAASGKYTFTALLVSEFDLDNDGVSNGLDNCPATGNASQADADQDYVGDACEQDATQDFDVDGDGPENGYDNCIFVANAGQQDNDFDDIGDACDPNPSVPDGPNYVMSCWDPVGIGQSDPGGAVCVQGVQTPTPPAVGGIAELPEVDATPLEAAEPSSGNAALLVGVIAGSVAGAVALGGVAWYARKRRVRS